MYISKDVTKLRAIVGIRAIYYRFCRLEFCKAISIIYNTQPLKTPLPSHYISVGIIFAYEILCIMLLLCDHLSCLYD